MTSKEEKPTQEATSCGYQGYEFGAGSYPDSLCVNGRLFDADDCDDAGNLYQPSDHIPCPMCHEKEAIEYWTEYFHAEGRSKAYAQQVARALIGDIRKNRQNGTEPWKQAVRP